MFHIHTVTTISPAEQDLFCHGHPSVLFLLFTVQEHCILSAFLHHAAACHPILGADGMGIMLKGNKGSAT